MISYGTGSIPEVVEDGVTGKLVPLGDTDRLARTAMELMEDVHLAYGIGLAGRERVRALFSWERTARVIGETLHVVRKG